MINKYFFPIYRVLVPKPIRTGILKKNLRKRILNYYSSLPADKVNDEQREVLKYLENNPVTIFPYSFSHDYSPEKIKVHPDPLNRMRYVVHDGKKLFFRESWSIRRIQRAYADLSREQDNISPHKYLAGDFIAGSEDVIADIGAAEGNFSLSVIEKVRKIYLIEYDPEWIKALEATFSPWKDKTEIINKYVADFDDDKHITLDTLLSTRADITFLKIDVDGNEQKVLDGAPLFLSGNRNMKIAICTYHKSNDEEDFMSLFEKKGFTVKPSRGYMIHYYDKKLSTPFLRRGLIRAVR
jgi:predicted RNA methylase